MSMKERFTEQLKDSRLRAETIIHVPSMALYPDAWPDAVSDAFDNGEAEGLFVALGIEVDSELTKEDFVATLAPGSRRQWLVQFATPLPLDAQAGEDKETWGCYLKQWFCSDTFDDTCRQARQWRARLRMSRSGRPKKRSGWPPFFEDAPTTWEQRFSQALQILCGGSAPPPGLVQKWIRHESDDLQEWTVSHQAFPWSMGITIIEAATGLADQPDEGGDHE